MREFCFAPKKKRLKVEIAPKYGVNLTNSLENHFLLQLETKVFLMNGVWEWEPERIQQEVLGCRMLTYAMDVGAVQRPLVGIYTWTCTAGQM